MSASVCPICDTQQEVKAADGRLWTNCTSCNALIFVPTGGPRVLMVHGSDNLCQYMGTVLTEAGFSPLRAPTGTEALNDLDRYRPAAAVLDVGLTDVMAFQLVEHMRRPQSGLDTRVVLLASVYRRTAYKRSPTSLYGADDYVEQHHIPDLLPLKLCDLLDIDPSGVAALTTRQPPDVEGVSDRPDLWGKERVWALAHSIVSDIALYHQSEFQEVASTGDRTNLVNGALEEGRELLSKMAEESDYPSEDPIFDAFETFISKLRQPDE